MNAESESKNKILWGIIGGFVFISLCAILYFYYSDSCRSLIFKDRAVACGWLSVPADHTDPEVATLQIPYLHYAGKATDSEQPLVIIPGGGGPGASLGFGRYASAGYFAQMTQPLLDAGMDVVFVEQRGVGLAQPDGSCPGLVAAVTDTLNQDLTRREELDRVLPVIRQCRETAQNNNLDVGWFTTEQSARDFLLLADELGASKIRLIATSYASTIALEMMAMEPGRIDAAVLDSAVAPGELVPPVTYSSLAQAINSVLQACGQDIECAAAYPDVENFLDRFLAKVDRERPTRRVELYDRDPLVVLVNPQRAMEILFTAIYWSEDIASLPSVLASALDDDWSGFDGFAWYLADYLTDETYGDILSHTVGCGEDLPAINTFLRNSPGFEATLTLDDREELYVLRTLCDTWDVTTLRATPRMSDTPVLMLAGTFDPITPVSHARALQPFLQRSRIVADGGEGHAPFYSQGCAWEQAVAFLLEPTNWLAENQQAEHLCANESIDWVIQ